MSSLGVMATKYIPHLRGREERIELLGSEMVFCSSLQKISLDSIPRKWPRMTQGRAAKETECIFLIDYFFEPNPKVPDKFLKSQ